MLRIDIRCPDGNMFQKQSPRCRCTRPSYDFAGCLKERKGNVLVLGKPNVRAFEAFVVTRIDTDQRVAHRPVLMFANLIKGELQGVCWGI